jgi:tRNA (guanine9-N1)-methyltransferase
VIEDFKLSVASSSNILPTMPLATDDQEPPAPEGLAISLEETTVGPLSKKAQKKAVKAARYAEQKAERRAREKERKKLKRAAAQPGTHDEDGAVPRPKRLKLDPTSQTKFGARLVIDLGFDDKMTEKVRSRLGLPLFAVFYRHAKEVVSLSSQLAYTYSANRKAPCPFEHLLCTSLDGRTLTRLESLGDAGYRRWSGVEWWTGSYESLWDPSDGGATAGRGTIVYLTADSDVELTELEEGETYIIGGIVDHNRYKVCEASHVQLSRADRARDRTYVSTKRSRPVSAMLVFQ